MQTNKDKVFRYKQCHLGLIPGAQFEEHCSKISRDIYYSVFYCFSATIYDVIAFLICIIKNVIISKTKKDNPKRKTFFFFMKSLHCHTS